MFDDRLKMPLVNYIAPDVTFMVLLIIIVVLGGPFHTDPDVRLSARNLPIHIGTVAKPSNPITKTHAYAQYTC